MKNGWTGGQYSIFRVLFGLYLFTHFVSLLSKGSGFMSDGAFAPGIFGQIEASWLVISLIAVAVVSSVAFALGWHDRIAAVLLFCVLVLTVVGNPLVMNPSLASVGLLLLAHSMLPPAPYGSLAARRRVDPRGGWSMPPAIFAAAWIVMSIGYSYSGWTKLVSPSWTDGTALARVMANPLARDVFLRDWLLHLPDSFLAVATIGALGLELFFVVLALIRPIRPWLWLTMLSMHLGLILLIDFADLSMGMVMVHLFTFNPDWIPGVGDQRDRVFYDGSCGLCHGAVRWILAEDRRDVIDFEPLDSDAFRELSADFDGEIPDSVVVRRGEGDLKVKSAAILYLMGRMGGVWRVLGWLGRAIPRPLRDVGYDFVARIRHRLFDRPKDACPMLPPDLRHRVS